MRHADGGVTILRAAATAESAGPEQAGINSRVFPGDVLSTDPSQRAEIELAGGTVVRVDAASGLTFLALPDPYAEFADNTVLQLAEGALRVGSAAPTSGAPTSAASTRADPRSA